MKINKVIARVKSSLSETTDKLYTSEKDESYLIIEVREDIKKIMDYLDTVSDLLEDE